MPEILSTTAEVSVAFVGFSALIGVFRGSQGRLGELRMMFMIELGLLALVFSLLPHVFSYFGVSPQQIWRISSGLLGAAFMLEIVHLVLEIRRLPGEGLRPVAPRLAWALASGVVLVGLALVANSIGWPAAPSFSVYFLGIFWLLLNAAIIFAASFWLGRSGSRGDAT